jgi:hypothetical protein
MGLDLNPPGGNGADPIGELREASPGGAVLIVSASLHPTNTGKAMRAGDEVLGKLSSPRGRRRREAPGKPPEGVRASALRGMHEAPAP